MSYLSMPVGVLRTLHAADIQTRQPTPGYNGPYDFVQDNPASSNSTIIITNTKANFSEGETWTFVPPKDKNWYLLAAAITNINLFIGAGGATAGLDRYAIDDQQLRIDGLHLSTGFGNGSNYFRLWGRHSQQEVPQGALSADLSPEFALPIRQNILLATNIFNNGVGPSAFDVAMYIWESAKQTPAPAVLTTIPAQTVDQSWQ